MAKKTGQQKEETKLAANLLTGIDFVPEGGTRSKRLGPGRIDASEIPEGFRQSLIARGLLVLEGQTVETKRVRISRDIDGGDGAKFKAGAVVTVPKRQASDWLLTGQAEEV